GVEVEIERFEDGEPLEIAAVVWVERKGQKKIVIGQGGSQLKKVGIAARRAIERRFGKAVDLRLWVRHKANWSDDARALKRFGYE
ncbi:MAG: KH domain-containing protein, partial [Pseudomonadota bacterium]